MPLPLNTKCFGQKATITRSGEEGTVISFSRHMRQKEGQFMLEYTANDGRAVEGWFFASELTVDGPQQTV